MLHINAVQIGVWSKQFAWKPKRCVYSNRLIWLKYAYTVTRMLQGPGTPIHVRLWADPAEYIILRLKGTIT